MYFSLRFVLWLKWSDDRLTYENLDENLWKNEVSNDKAAKLWTPLIVFKNNIEGKFLKFDPSSPSLFLTSKTMVLQTTTRGVGSRQKNSKLYNI